MILIIITDVLIIITACLGLYGIKKGKPCLLFLFTVLVAIFCILLLSGGAVVSYAPGIITDRNLMCNATLSQEPEYQWISDVITLVSQSSTFCTPVCKCDLKDISAYSMPDQILLGLYTGRDGTDTQIQKCSIFISSVKSKGTSEILTYMDPLGAIEKSLQCTGWCDAPTLLFQKFSNVHNAQPNTYCYDALSTWVLKWTHVMEYSCFIAAGVLALVFAFNICICYHPDRRNKRISERFYDSGANTDYHAY
jgi:hypothetical protein